MCAVFGLIDYGKVLTTQQRECILWRLSVDCEERGIDATGYAFRENGKLKVVKKPVPAHEMFLTLNEDSNVILGHTRMTTQGKAEDNFNNHPFLGSAGGTPFALAHNGIIMNDEVLREEFNIPQTKIVTDSYIAVQLLEKFGELSEKSLANMAEKILGSFVFTLLDNDNNSYFVRGNNPLALYWFKEGFYVYSSTSGILESTLRTFNRMGYTPEKVETQYGDILKIDANGKLTKSKFNTSDYDYYSRGFSYDCFYNSESSEVTQLKDYANVHGLSSDNIDLLLEYGYDADDIIGLIDDPEMLDNALLEVLGWYYGEDLR